MEFNFYELYLETFEKSELGAKCNNILVDGISFIERLSLGTQKEHYGLRRVKARKKETEILYIFIFGIHTANAADRLMKQPLAEAA